MNDHGSSPFALQGSHDLAQAGRRGSSDWLVPPTTTNQSTRPALSIRTERSQPRLACPYYKRSPNQQFKRASCVHPGFPSIARLKEHLYRRHQLFRCPRCKECFTKESDFNEHQEAQINCQDQGYQQDYNDGFDQKQTRLLKKRERTGTAEDKWRDIFQTLFPEDQAMPTPYYHDTPSPELDNYHQYCRDHTDRVLRHRLGSNPDEVMRSLVRDVQEQLFGEFHTLQSDDDRSSCTSRASTPLSSASPMTPSFEFEDDVPAGATDDGMQDHERPFAEVVQGEVMLPNPQHVSLQYQTPQIVLSRAFSPGPQSCEEFTQANSITHVNMTGNSHAVSSYYGFDTDFVPSTNHFQCDDWMVDSQMGDWSDSSAPGPSGFGT